MILPAITFDWSLFTTNTILIEQRTQTGTNALGEPTFNISTVYNGPANIFDVSEDTIYDVHGVLISTLEKFVIDVQPNATPPVVQIGSRITFTDDDLVSHKYLVRHVHFWTMAPQSVEITAESNKSW